MTCFEMDRSCCNSPFSSLRSIVHSTMYKDTNEDGVFSLSELQNWAETNIIIKLAEDGREKDVDDLITKRLEDFNSKEKKRLDVEAEEWKGI